jgi:hypothetical protein
MRLGCGGVPPSLATEEGTVTNTIRRTVGWIAAVVLAIGLLPALVPSLATHAHAATCGTAGCAVTVQGVELDGVTPIAQ